MRIKLTSLRRAIKRVLLEMSVYDMVGKRKLHGKNITVIRGELDLNKLSGLEQKSSSDFSPKPNGLWYGCDDSWIQYVNEPDNEMKSFKKGRSHLYTLELNYTTIQTPNNSAVCKIDNDDDFEQFLELYGGDGRYSSPDWNRFSKDFGGVEFCPLPTGPMWIRGYDVDSGCIWNGGAIKSSELLMHDPDAAPKPKPNTIGHAFELYPEIYESFCDYRDIDQQGFREGGENWGMSIEEFLEKHGEVPHDQDDWGYRFNDVTAATMMLQFIHDPNNTAFHGITYSSIDIDQAYERLQRAFREFNVEEPDDLENQADSMSDNRSMDEEIGVTDYSDWY